PFLPRTFSASTTPAALTTPRSEPISAAVASAFCTLASSVTSTPANLALLPSADATRAPAASFTSAMTTRPPDSTSIRAVASPRPEAPPVTRKAALSNGFNLARLIHRAPDGVVIVGQLHGIVGQPGVQARKRSGMVAHLE